MLSDVATIAPQQQLIDLFYLAAFCKNISDRSFISLELKAKNSGVAEQWYEFAPQPPILGDSWTFKVPHLWGI